MTNNIPITRFAPSPTGFLHLGHVASAMFSFNFSKERSGEMVLRIEDLDKSRCKEEYIQSILDDLNWLGINYRRTQNQSLRMKFYSIALEKLRSMDLIYPCWLTRKEIINATSAPHNSSLFDTDLILDPSEMIRRRGKGLFPAWRLRIKNAIQYANQISEDLFWVDEKLGKFKLDVEKFGDFIIARKDISTSYHLAVTLDDSFDGVTHVTRGSDLLETTNIHRLIQIILSLKQTKWVHHPLVLDKDGKRMAKRKFSKTIKNFREIGYKPSEVIDFQKAAHLQKFLSI